MFCIIPAESSMDQSFVGGIALDRFLEARRQFPIVGQMIYLDVSRSIPPPTCVTRAIEGFYRRMSEEGEDREQWEKVAEDVRRKFARLINAHPDEVAIIRNTTEGLNIAANGLPLAPGDNVIITDMEHLNNAYPWINLKERKGIEVRILRNREGRLILDDLERLVDKRTRVLAMSFVSFGNGYRVDLRTFGRFCKERDIYFVVDGIQGVGRLAIDVRDCLIDIMSCGGHKGLMAGHGIGCLFASSRCLEDLAVIFAGPPVELRHEPVGTVMRQSSGARRFHAGSLNYPGIHALNTGLDFIFELGIEAIEARDLYLGDILINGLQELRIKILSPLDKGELSGIVTFTTPDNNRIAAFLEENRIRVSCRGGGIRVSPHFYNTPEEIMRTVEVIRKGMREPT